MKEQITIVCCALFLLCLSGCTRSYEKENKELLDLVSKVPVPISTTNTDAAEPSVAVAIDGSIFVVWVEHHAGGRADVLMKKVNANAADSSTQVRVNPDIDKATAWRGDPPTIAIAPDGAIFVAWTSRTFDKGHENNLYLSASRNGGISFEKPVKINDDEKPGVHGMHSLAIDGKGRIYLAWLDERNISPAAPTEKHRGEAHAMESNREVFTAYSDDGGHTISRNQMIARDACPCCKTAVTTSPDGAVYIGWRQVLTGDLRHIAIASSIDNGRTYSSPVIVSDDKWVIAGCPVSGPALSASANGRLRVLWYTKGEAGSEGLYAARSSDGGKTFSPRQLVSGGTIFGNPLLLQDAKAGNDIAIWQAGDSSLMRSEITSDGSTRGTPTTVTTGKLPAAALANGQSVLAYISSGNNQRSVWLIRSSVETSSKL